jgi:hypothetical protein
MLEYVTTHDHADTVFSDWLIDRASRANTDHGRLYVRLAQDTVRLYRDAARTLLVAAGSLEGNDVTLTAENDSGLGGSMRVNFAGLLDATIDVFYADDDDVSALQKDVAGFLVNGDFAGRPGFADPLARAKRVMDALVNARLAPGWRADDLQPLAGATARFALFFIYDCLSSRADDAASHRASHWRREARTALAAVTLSISGQAATPFTPRVERA